MALAKHQQQGQAAGYRWEDGTPISHEELAKGAWYRMEDGTLISHAEWEEAGREFEEFKARNPEFRALLERNQERVRRTWANYLAMEG